MKIIAPTFFDIHVTEKLKPFPIMIPVWLLIPVPHIFILIRPRKIVCVIKGSIPHI